MPRWANGAPFEGEAEREGESNTDSLHSLPKNTYSLLWGIPRQLQLQLQLQLYLQLQLLRVFSSRRTNVTHRADQMKLLETKSQPSLSHFPNFLGDKHSSAFNDDTPRK